MKHQIPTQEEGRKMDAMECLEFQSLLEAETFYNILQERLFTINNWYKIAKLPMASFNYLDSSGLPNTDKPKIGGYLRINIPSPGLPSTDGYDYVRITNIDQTDNRKHQIVTITLSPSENPLSEEKETTQHFFKNIASSTIQIQRIDKKVFANYFGRNEVINLEVNTLPDKIRNLIIGVGAKLGASFPQWKSLLKGLMDLDLQHDTRDSETSN